MDSLGALVEGNKARMAEDTTRINQDKVLQEIAAAAQKMQQEAALHPGAMDEQQARIKQSNAAADYSGTLSTNAKAEENRKKSAWFLGKVIQEGGVPGAVDGYAEEAGIPANHPLRQMAKSAWKDSQGWDSKTQGPSPIEQLQQKLAMGDDKSRQQTEQNRVTMEKQTAINDAQYKREQLRQEEMTKRSNAMIAAKQAAAELKAKAAASGDKTLEAYAVSLDKQATQAQIDGNVEKANELRAKAEAVLDQMERMRTAQGTANFANERTKLLSLTGGKVDIGSAAPAPATAKPTTAAPAAAAKPAPDQAKIKSALGAAYDPNKTYEVDPDGTIYEVRPKK